MAQEKSFGEFLKERRIATGLTLRAFCVEFGFDSGNMSKLERGILQPPQSEELLTKYAEALNITRGSDAWFEFFDLAAAECGRIPPDVLSDEDVVAKLPVLFRTLRGQMIDKKKLDEFIETIRRT